MKLEVGHIYVIQEGLDGSVKIGWSENGWDRRLKELQVGNSRKLRLLLVFSGSLETEMTIHGDLENYHIQGEWFTWAPGVRRYLLELLRSGNYSVVYRTRWG